MSATSSKAGLLGVPSLDFGTERADGAARSSFGVPGTPSRAKNAPGPGEGPGGPPLAATTSEPNAGAHDAACPRPTEGRRGPLIGLKFGRRMCVQPLSLLNLKLKGLNA